MHGNTVIANDSTYSNIKLFYFYFISNYLSGGKKDTEISMRDDKATFICLKYIIGYLANEQNRNI